MVSYKIQDVLIEGRRCLYENSVLPNGADWLMMDLFHLTQTELIMNDVTLTEAMYKLYTNGIKQLAKGVPLARVTGVQEFYGRLFKTTIDTLIPRPETEELVYYALKYSAKRIADIGTGTGCIAITLALESDATVIATDISSDALAVAKENNDALEASVQFYRGDLLQPLIAMGIQVDMLVSNPPYIAHHEKNTMATTVLNHDPHIALFAEDNGLILYKRMIDDMTKVVRPGGVVLFEIGFKQGSVLKNYIQTKYPLDVVHVRQDINGKDRIIEWRLIEQ